VAEKAWRIGFNGRPFCSNELRGLGRHTLELIKGLKAQHPELEIFLYTYAPVTEEFKKLLPYATVRDRRVRPKLLWDLWSLRAQLAEDQIDLYHSTINLGVPLLFFKKLPLVVTIHDHFTHVAQRPLWGRLQYAVEFALLRRSQLVFTVSADAREKIARLMGIRREKIRVSYNGVGLAPVAAPPVEERYFLYVGGMEARKNISVLLEAFLSFHQREPTSRLKLVGNPEHASARDRDLIQAHADIIEVVQGAGDAQLAALYQGARALIFPSLEEGFGLPLIEAMALGCPVIASDIEVFKEIGADAALYFPRASASALTEQMRGLEADAELRDRLCARGRERARKFRWETLVAQTYEAYCELLRK